MAIDFILMLLFSGFIGGILAGMFGIGGGIVYTFVISIVLHQMVPPDVIIKPEIIISNSLLGVLFAALSSSIKMYRTGNFPFKKVLIASAFALVASFIVRHFVLTQPWYSQDLFRGVLLTLVSLTVIRLFWKQKEQITRDPKDIELPLVGSVGGSIATLSGFGGGIVMVPMLLLLKSYTHTQARAISLGVITINSTFLVAFALFSKLNISVSLPVNNIGNIFPSITGALIIGTLLGGPLGVKIAQKLTQKILLNSYLVLLIGLIIHYSFKLLI